MNQSPNNYFTVDEAIRDIDKKTGQSFNKGTHTDGSNKVTAEVTVNEGVAKKAVNSAHSRQEPENADSSPSLLDRASKALKEFASISEVMRLVGASVVLASMSVFLMQDSEQSTDIELFLLMLAQTVILATAGFIMFKGLKENKSARLFFALGLVSMTVNFTTLGALFYSAFGLDAPIADYAKYAQWIPDDMGTLLLASAGSFILLPLAYFSFSVLSRPAAKPLTLIFFGLNLLLLLPLRDPSIILAISLALLIGLGGVLFIKGESSVLANWKTLEGKFARIILFAPLVVFTSRSLVWYKLDGMAVLMILVIAYIIIRQVSLIVRAGLMQRLTYGLSLVVGLLLAAWISFELFAVPATLIAPLFILLFSGVCADIYLRTSEDFIKKVVYYIGSVVMAVALMFNHVIYDTLLTFSIAVASSIAVFLVAYKLRSKFNIILSGLMMLALPTLYAHQIINLIVNSGWLGLAVSGISIIVLASLLDRYGAVLKLKLSQKKIEFA